MSPFTHKIPKAVYLLADNLDAALAAGEDLLKERHFISTADGLVSGDDLAEQINERHRFLERVRALELTLIQRTLRSRIHSAELGESDQRFRSITGLFAGGTAALLDAVEELGDRTAIDDRLQQDAVAYLRGRGILGDEAAGFGGIEEVEITDGFLVAERIALGPLLDLIATFLDVLELHFELFAKDADDHEPEAQTPAPTKVMSLADVLASMR